jgi:hypothetical protein
MRLAGPGYVLGGYYVQSLHFSWAAGLVRNVDGFALLESPAGEQLT